MEIVEYTLIKAILVSWLLETQFTESDGCTQNVGYIYMSFGSLIEKRVSGSVLYLKLTRLPKRQGA